LIEILDARKNPSTPVMTVYLRDGTSKKKAQGVAWEIQKTTIADLGGIITDRANLRILIEVDEDTLYERDLTLSDIIEKLEAKLKIPIEVEGYTLTDRGGGVHAQPQSEGVQSWFSGAVGQES
jgi:DNA-directed RNA polymerase subunit A"